MMMLKNNKDHAEKINVYVLRIILLVVRGRDRRAL